MSFYKGDMVKLDVKACFTEAQGGGRKYPLIHGHADSKGVVYGSRKPTADEIQTWRDSDLSKGLDSAGETKLPPRSVSVELRRDEVFQVVRGRARMPWTWGNPRAGYMIVRRGDGVECHVKRDLITHA